MAERWQADDVETRERARTEASELSWALRELNRAVAEIDHALARRLAMRPSDYAAMGHVMSAQAPLGPAELSVRLGISTGSATELVDRLERAGHLERRRDSHDRRRVSLHATQPAVELILRELGPLFVDLDELAGEFTPDEQATVARYLRLAARRMGAYASS